MALPNRLKQCKRFNRSRNTTNEALLEVSIKTLLTNFLLCTLFACSPAPDIGAPNTETKPAETDGIGSFKLANREIREETLQMLGDADIEYWIGDDGAINYNLVDGEAIDRIGNDVILTYIRRN
jgi:hypothetical protein